MNGRTVYKPKRHIRNEIYSLAAVLAAPATMALIFPYKAIGWSADPPAARSQAVCAFVSLTDEESDAAIDAARASIRTTSDDVRWMRADLSIAAIPEDETGDVLDIAERKAGSQASTVRYTRVPLPATLAADGARKLPRSADQDRREDPFPRKELLEINLD